MAPDNQKIDAFKAISNAYHRIILTKSFSDLVIGSFFVVFIFRITQNVQLTIIGLVLYYLGSFSGVLLACLLSLKVSFLNILRLAFLSQGILYFLLIIFWPVFHSWAFIFIFVLGMCLGAYLICQHLFNLSVVNSHENRHKIIFSTLGIVRILGTILPILSGFFINEIGYPFVFGVTGIVFIISSSISFNLKLPKSDIFSIIDLRKAINLCHFKEYSAYIFIISFFGELRNYSLFLIPFFFLNRNEFNIGILLSVIAVTTGTVTYLSRNRKREETERYSIFGGIFISIINFAFGVIWSPIMLIARSLLLPIGELFFFPQGEGDEYVLMQQMLGQKKLTLGIEFQFVREFLIFIGRAIAGALFLYLLFTYNNDYMELGQHLTIAFALWPLIGFLLRKFFIDSLREEKRY